MPKTQTTQQTNEPAHQCHKTRPTAQEPVALALPVASDIIRFGMADPRVAGSSDILLFQRAVGNRAIGHLIQAKPFVNSSAVSVQRLTVLVLQALERVKGEFWSR